jgi:adenylate cyclase
VAKRRNGQEAYRKLQDHFRDAYRNSGLAESAQKTVQAGTATSATFLGHPEFVNLAVGQTRRATAVVSFIDIRGFTKLAFALEDRELLRIIQALTEAAVNGIKDGGGYVGEFTGDGVMAYFGDSSTTDEDATLSALETTSLLFKTVKEIVNPELNDAGVEPIRLAGGMEYGDVLWARIGVGATSQLKPISLATFLAGKLATRPFTATWECKIGAELAAWLPDAFKKKAEAYSFELKGESYSRELYAFDWSAFATQTLQNQNNLEESILSKRATSAPKILTGTRTLVPDASRSGPRPLKDQPFF